MANKKEVIHLRNRALEFIKTLENGFNGVYFYELDVCEPTNPEDDNMGPEVAAAWDRDYVILHVGADPEFEGDNQYETFDYQSFEWDFKKYAREFFGPVDKFGFDNWGMNYGGDIEIYRECPEYKKWLKKRGN